MEFLADIDPFVRDWVLIPLLVFLARVMDVSIGTLRIVFVSRGDKMIAPLLGFVETIIWLMAISQVMTNVTNIAGYLSFGLGYATGNYIGLMLEERLAMGQVVIRTIVPNHANDLSTALRDKNYRVTQVDAMGKDGKTQIVFMIVPRKQIEDVLTIVNTFNPGAFYSIEDIRKATSDPNAAGARPTFGWFRYFPLRKGK